MSSVFLTFTPRPLGAVANESPTILLIDALTATKPKALWACHFAQLATMLPKVSGNIRQNLVNITNNLS